MKSTCVPLVFTRPTSSALDEERKAVAERDVARRVLVEQRVVEDRAERADAALRVDERELAEPARARRRARAALRSASAFSSASISTALPPSKRTRSPRMIVPSRSTSGFVEVTWPCVRSGSGVVKTSSVGRFGKCRSPSAVVKSAAHHLCVGSMPTVSSVPGPRSSNRVEAVLGEPLRRVVQHGHALVPRRPGSGSSSRSTCSSSLQSRSYASSSAESG